MEQTLTPGFLSEIGDMTAWICDLLDGPRSDQWHWPTYYLLYVDVDRLAGLLARVNHLLKGEFDAFDNDVIAKERVANYNELFALLGKQQKAVIQWLFQIVRYTRANPADPSAHARINAHVHPKSGWYQIFIREYLCGAVTADGNTLQRTVLPVFVDEQGERIDHATARCMLCQQSFDISTPAARLALAHATNEVQARLGKVSAAMTAFLVANCTLRDLLHPCSY